MKKEDLPFFIRPMEKEDENFIYATWIQSLRHRNAFFKAIDQGSYYRTYKKIIELILMRPKIEVRILCLKEDPSIILGYSVLEGNSLHWMFIKARFRNMGLLKHLIPNKIEIVTHIRNIGHAIRSGRVIFNPFF